MRTLFLMLILCISIETLFAQLSFSFDADAFTNVDFPDGDGIAGDACSSAICTASPLIEALIQLDQFDCNFNLPDGFPGIYFYYDLSINHTNYPVQDFLSYEIPYAFQYTLEGDSYFPENSFYGNYTMYQNSNVGTGDITLIGPPTGPYTFNIDLNNDHIMTLPKNSYDFTLQIDAFVTSGMNELIETNSNNQLSIIVPSQFYLDNGLTSPSFTNINVNAGGGLTFPVLERCAEDLYLEAGVALGSYSYSAAKDLYVDCAIGNNTQVVFSGGNSVVFGPGYSVELGSSMATNTYSGCVNP